MIIESKQCPVCGAESALEGGIVYVYFPSTEKYAIRCENCGCSTTQCETEKEAEDAWEKMCEIVKGRMKNDNN